MCPPAEKGVLSIIPLPGHHASLISRDREFLLRKVVLFGGSSNCQKLWSYNDPKYTFLLIMHSGSASALQYGWSFLHDSPKYKKVNSCSPTFNLLFSWLKIPMSIHQSMISKETLGRIEQWIPEAKYLHIFTYYKIFTGICQLAYYFN